MDQFGDFISRVGFPIFVAVYMLTIGRKEIRDLAREVRALREALTQRTIYVGPERERPAATAAPELEN